MNMKLATTLNPARMTPTIRAQSMPNITQTPAATITAPRVGCSQPQLYVDPWQT